MIERRWKVGRTEPEPWGARSMPIQFHCACGKKLQADDALAGRMTRCPQCQAVLKIPRPECDRVVRRGRDSAGAVSRAGRPAWVPPALYDPEPPARTADLDSRRRPFRRSDDPTSNTAGLPAGSAGLGVDPRVCVPAPGPGADPAGLLAARQGRRPDDDRGTDRGDARGGDARAAPARPADPLEGARA